MSWTLRLAPIHPIFFNVAKYHLGKVKMSANAASGLPHLQYVTFGVASRGFTGFQGSLLYTCSVIS